MPDNDVDIDGTKYKKNDAIQVDISLFNDTGDVVALTVPIIITVPIPSGISPSDFWILHYKSDGSYEVINPTLNGDGTCTFTVTEFSVFVFVNVIPQVTDNASDTGSRSSGSGSGSGYSSIAPISKPVTIPMPTPTPTTTRQRSQ